MITFLSDDAKAIAQNTLNWWDGDSLVMGDRRNQVHLAEWQQAQLTEDLELLLNDLAYYAIMTWKQAGGPEATLDKSYAKLQIAIRDTLMQNVDLLKKYLSE